LAYPVKLAPALTIETMNTIRKGRLDRPAGQSISAAQQFYNLAV
jgi:hypothetical protein